MANEEKKLKQGHSTPPLGLGKYFFTRWQFAYDFSVVHRCPRILRIESAIKKIGFM